MPTRRSGPVTVTPRSSRTTSAPISANSPRNTSPGWWVADGQWATVTRPPVTAPAARNGVALERSGSISHVRAPIGPGSTRHTSGVPSSTVTPASRSAATVITTWGIDGTGGPAWRIVTPRS